MRRTNLLLLVALVLWLGPGAHAGETNSLVWQADRDSVSADLHGEALWPLLEDIAHQTGWHIFVEPGADQKASVKFSHLPPGEALPKLLGNLNYAMVPQTNGPQQLYVFRTTMNNATRRVARTAAKAGPMKHVANQLLVKLKPGADINAIAKRLGAKVVSRDDKLGIYLLEFPDAATTDAALAELKTDSQVASVDYNYLYDAPPAPQALANAPAGSGPVSLSLNDNSPTDPCTPIIGLLDTAVQPLGGQLDSFIMSRANVTGDEAAANTTTLLHGTAMAQAIATAVKQQAGSSGSTSVRVLSVDVYGNSENTTSWSVAEGLKKAVDGGATVINMSLAGSTDSAVLDDLIQQALAKGVVIFAAAGNQPVDTPNYPAAIPGVNAVTALGAPGQLASYANYGSFVELALPGTSTAYLNNQAWVVQGTSTATAYASGVAAGAKAANCQSWPQIMAAMQQKFPVPATGTGH